MSMIERVARAIHRADYLVSSDPWMETPGSCQAEFAAQAAIDAYKAHLKESGYVIVPREPTEEMLSAGFHVELEEDTPDSGPAYKAMIDVAGEEHE